MQQQSEQNQQTNMLTTWKTIDTPVAIDTPVDLEIWKLIHTPPVT